MKALGVTAESYHNLLASVHVKKKKKKNSFRSRSIVSSKTLGDDWKLDTLMNLWRKRFRHEQAATISAGHGSQKKSTVKDQHTSAALLAENSSKIPQHALIVGRDTRPTPV